MLDQKCPCTEDDLRARVIVDGPFRPPTRIDPRSVAQSIASSGVSEDDLLQRVAPQLGDIDVLKWLRSRSRSSTSSDDFRWKGYASMSAALEGHIEVLAWLQTEGCPPTPFSCTVAALGGHIHVLTWLREHGYPWGTETCTAAASGGKLQTLRWLIDNTGLTFQLSFKVAQSFRETLMSVEHDMKALKVPFVAPISDYYTIAALFHSVVVEDRINKIALTSNITSRLLSKSLMTIRDERRLNLGLERIIALMGNSTTRAICSRDFDVKVLQDLFNKYTNNRKMQGSIKRLIVMTKTTLFDYIPSQLYDVLIK